MEGSKRLIPYSVYLSEEIHNALKEKARSRQASKVVRDAITMILEAETSSPAATSKDYEMPWI